MARPKGRIVYRGVMGETKAYFLGDREVTKEEFDAAFPPKELGVPDGHRCNLYPYVSEAFAVHPDQVDAANERARKAGIGARYEKGTGMCMIDSDGDKVKLAKLEGFVNRQAGYR